MLASRLKHFFSIPVFLTSEETHLARLLASFSWALALVIVLVLLAGVFTGTPELAYYLLLGLIYPIVLATWQFVRLKHVKRAALFFSFSFWVYLSTLLLMGTPEAIRINFSIYYLAVISSAAVLGSRGAVIAGLASVFMGIFLFYMVEVGWPFEPLVTFDPRRNLVNSSLSLLLAVAFTYICARGLYEAVQLAMTAGSERATSEEALRNERDLVKALTEASTAVSGSLVFEEVLDNIMEQISKVIPSDAVNIMLIDGKHARIVRWRGYDQFGAEHKVANKVFEIDATPNLKHMHDNGEPIGAANAANSPTWVRAKEFSWLRSYVGAPIKIKQKVVGFVNVDSARPDFYSPEQLGALKTFAAQIAVTVENTQLFSQVQKYAEQLEDAFLETTLALAKTLDVRDTYTADHSELISIRAQKTLRALGGDEHDIMLMGLAAKLHDIGKIGVTDQILHKPGPLSAGEWQAMKKHPQIGGDILKRVKGMEEVAAIVEAHQEKFDGTGYPAGLAGDAIPFKARILSVVDAYGAMTENRVYRKAKTHREAVAELQNESGKHFDPAVVKAFLEILEQEKEPS